MQISNLISNISNLIGKKTLAAEVPKEKIKRYLPYTPKSVFRTRQDIASWTQALAMAQSADPRNYPLQLLYNEILTDALLSGLKENRSQQLFSADFTLRKPNGDVDEEQTDLLRNIPSYRLLTTAILDSTYYGYSLVELNLYPSPNGGVGLNAEVLPRTNTVPQLGLFYPDYGDETKRIPYRELREFGTWILEFNSGGLGLLNKTVSHALFKRFAQSCWSELCEIYGIPPRVIKTNTQDTTMLNRAEQMMRDTGAAPWYIIDQAEVLEWGHAINTNGEVFENLINLCKNEMSMVINGAIIGQDTKFGNRSKDESGQETLWLLVQSDMALVEEQWNTAIIPALNRIGILKGDVRYEFEPAEDTTELWKRTAEALPYFTVDAGWVKDKFGIEITGERIQKVPDPEPETTQKNKKLKLDGFFV